MTNQARIDESANQRFTAMVPVAVSCVVLLCVYLLTLAPTITWAHYGADGGDLVTAVARGGIPHPPGSPTYLLLGELFIRFPWRDPAWRLNLMSAVMATGAACLTTAAMRFILPFATRRSLFAICTGLCLGLAPLFWSQAIITEVYAPAAFFVALVTYLALRGGPIWAVGLAWGVGMGVHPTLVFLAPLVVWKIEKKSQKQVWFLALLSLGVMYGPVLLTRDGPSPWGDAHTLEGWWALVSGRIYHGYLFGLPLTAWPQRLLAWVGLLARQFTPLGAMLAGLGWTRLWWGQRAFAFASALVLGAFSLYAISYDTADSLVYLVLALPVAALWLGAGLSQVANWLSRRVRWGAWAMLLLPLLQVLFFWGQMDLSTDRTAIEWTERTLSEAPPQAVILTNQDGHTFALWYAQQVLGQRPDVTVIDVDLWAQEFYQGMTTKELGIEEIARNLSPEIARNLSPEDAARRAERPIVKMTNDQ